MKTKEVRIPGMVSTIVSQSRDYFDAVDKSVPESFIEQQMSQILAKAPKFLGSWIPITEENARTQLPHKGELQPISFWRIISKFIG